MTLKKHKNNEAWWHAKNGEATHEQVAEFARGYQKYSAGAWAVCVAEGADWIAAHPVADVMAHTRGVGAVAVWVSDGHFAKVVWRKGGLPAWRDPAAELPDDDIQVVLRRSSDAYPLEMGVRDGGVWYQADLPGTTVDEDAAAVTGWLHLHEAAQILDAAAREVANG